MENKIEERLLKWGDLISKSPIDHNKKWMYDSPINDNNPPITDVSNIPFLPIAMKVSSLTISQNLVPVTPMDMIDHNELEKIKERILVENRNNSIDSIIDGSTFTEIKIENDDEFKELMKSSSPNSPIFYFDYIYNNEDEI